MSHRDPSPRQRSRARERAERTERETRESDNPLGITGPAPTPSSPRPQVRTGSRRVQDIEAIERGEFVGASAQDIQRQLAPSSPTVTRVRDTFDPPPTDTEDEGGRDLAVGDRVTIRGVTVTINDIDPVTGQVQGVNERGGLTGFNAADVARAGFNVSRGDTGDSSRTLGGPPGFQGGISGGFLLGGFTSTPVVAADNPFRGPARDLYQPDIHGLPENIAEAREAQKWLQLRRPQLSNIVRSVGRPPTFDEDGKMIDPGEAAGVWMDIRTPGRPATAALAAQAELAELVQNEVLVLLQEDATFRADTAANTARQQHDQNLEVLKANFQTALQNARSQFEFDELNRQFQFDSAQLQQQFAQQTALLEAQNQFDLAVLDRESIIQAERDANQRLFQAEQNALDRALREAELEESVRSSRAIEQIRAAELNLEREQFQVELLAAISAAPQLLFFMDQLGVLGSFGQLGGGIGQTLSAFLEQLKQVPETNIQEFARLSGQEQAFQQFTTAATTGVSQDQALAELRGQAPRAVRNPVGLDDPVQPGRASRRIALGPGARS